MQMRHLGAWLLLLSFLMVQCQTARTKQVETDLSLIKTRLTQIEYRLGIDNPGAEVPTTDSSGRKFAGIQAKMEELQELYRKIQDDVEILKMAFKTGKMPGQGDENWIGDRVESLDERLLALEKAQAEILDVIASSRTTPKANRSKSGKSANSKKAQPQ